MCSLGKHHFTLTRQGDRLVAVVDGGTVLDVRTSAFSRTRLGLAAYYGERRPWPSFESDGPRLNQPYTFHRFHSVRLTQKALPKRIDSLGIAGSALAREEYEAA